MRKGTAIIGIGAGIIAIWLLAKGVVGKEGIPLEAGVYTGPLRYTGPKKTFKAALGECFDVIYTIDVWDPVYHEYLPPTDPAHDKILTGDLCMVQVQAPCVIYNFKWVQ